MRKLIDFIGEAVSTFWPILAIAAFMLASGDHDARVAKSVRDACIVEPTSCR